MKIEDYNPTNFNPDTFHPFKCLWLYDRRTQIFKELLAQVPPGDVEAYQRIDPYRSATSQVRELTNLSPEDFQYFCTVGGYIREYIEMTEMTQEDFYSRIDIYETPDSPILKKDKQTFEDFYKKFYESLTEDGFIDTE